MSRANSGHLKLQEPRVETRLQQTLASNATCALFCYGIPKYQSMTVPDDLVSLRGLHQDLLALEKSQLLDIERLLVDLEYRIDEFRKLLDKSPRKEASRNAILSGMNAPQSIRICVLLLLIANCYLLFEYRKNQGC